MTLFTAAMIVDDIRMDFDYVTIDECLTDDGLRALFDDGLISECRIVQGNKGIAKIPRALVSWDRFRKTVITHASSMLVRGAE